MTPGSAPLFSDADLRRYLAARADAVASRALPADDVALRVAVDLRLVRPRRTVAARALRLAVVVALLSAIVAGALYLVGRLGEDYSPAAPEVTVNVHGSPWAIAAASGFIWTAGYQEGVLFQVQPRTGEVLAELSTGKRVCGEIAAAYGYIWFTTCQFNAWLGRVDTATHHIDRLNGYGADQLGYGGGRVWTANDGRLEGLNPDTLATEASFPMSRGGNLLYAFDSIWIADADGRVVARIDPTTGRTIAEVGWSVDGAGGTVVHMAAAGGALWVVDEENLAVYRIDPETNAARRTVDLEFIDGTGFGDHPITSWVNEVWVRESDTSLAQLDPVTATVIARVETPAFGGGSLVVTRDAIWYGNLKGESIVGVRRE
jgi:streptogramin lyase